MQRYSLPTSTTIRDGPSLNLMIPLNEDPSPVTIQFNIITFMRARV